MVDANERVSETLRREFSEEAFDKLDMSEEKKKKIAKKIEVLFQHGIEVSAKYLWPASLQISDGIQSLYSIAAVNSSPFMPPQGFLKMIFSVLNFSSFCTKIQFDQEQINCPHVGKET